jgi:hypothetical protein
VYYLWRWSTRRCFHILLFLFMSLG